jgi:hypothetical protein
VILENLPDFVGIQAATRMQSEFMEAELGMFYSYYGCPRDM